jgi:hypothetical protein
MMTENMNKIYFDAKVRISFYFGFRLLKNMRGGWERGGVVGQTNKLTHDDQSDLWPPQIEEYFIYNT